MTEEGFGPHLTLDLIGCPKEILQDYNLHFNLLKELPEMIGMTPITQPYVFPYSGLVPEDRGITGIVIIAESHLSVHSFEDKGKKVAGRRARKVLQEIGKFVKETRKNISDNMKTDKE